MKEKDYSGIFPVKYGTDILGSLLLWPLTAKQDSENPVLCTML